jgi:PTS system trehalose-specific IIC component
MARAVDLALCGDLLPAAASADQRGLDLRFRNVIGDVPMSDGKTLAQMYPR